MDDDKMFYPCDDLADNIYSNIEDHNSLYTLAGKELQLSSNLEDPNIDNDWKSTNSHKSQPVIAHNTKAGNNTLRQGIF